MSKSVSLVSLSAVLMIGSGCGAGTVAKRVLKEVVGASSKAAVVPGTVSGNLSRFKDVQLKPPRTDLGGLVSAKFKGALPGQLRRYLGPGEKGPFPGGTPKLTIEPVIQWYYDAGGFNELLGSDSFVVVLFHLSADGQALGKVQLVTKNAASHTNETDLAKSMAKELAHWFKKRMKPK
ncbi:MAG: hypothetical protein ACE5E1_08345 [Phycisphaerae bacterium]